MPQATADDIAFEERGGVADLSDRAKFRLSGADRVRYLNGQITANVVRLGPAEAIPACVTTAKGRLCGEIFISATADALLIDAASELREPLLTRLNRYIISDDAMLEDVTDSLTLLHILPARGETPEGLLQSDHLAARHPRTARRFGPAGLDVFLPASDKSALLATESAFPVLSAAALEIIRIERGIPRWGRELSEDTLPPEAGLDLTHVDYHKGCYIGQEVISRLKSVGHVNRRLVGFILTDPAPGDSGAILIPGQRVFASADDTKPLGEITSAAFSTALGKPIALGYLRRGAPMSGLLARSATSAAPTIAIEAQELPFLK